MSISHPRLALVVALAGLVGACGSSSNSTPDTGAGDGSTHLDASPSGDAGDSATQADAPADVDAAPGTDASTDADASPSTDGSTDAGDPACAAPFTLTPDPGAQAAATAALAALDPTATLTWAPVRGTLSSISGLVVQLPDCTGTTDAYDQLFTVLERTPALFQIDRTEWNATGLQCSEILSSGFHTLVIRRTHYGPYSVANDVFSAVADVQGGVVILRNFSGVYIPKPSPSVITALQACPDRSQADLAPALRAQPFTYERYQPAPAPACTSDGTGTYTAMAADTLTFDPAITAAWDEGDTVTIHREGNATLVVGAADYTPELLNGSANCVDLDEVSHVGWIRTFNSVTGEILYDHATPDPYCTVCLH